MRFHIHQTPDTLTLELATCHENVSTYNLYLISKEMGKLGLVLIPPKYFSKYKKIFKFLRKSIDPSVFLDMHLLNLRVLDTERDDF